MCTVSFIGTEWNLTVPERYPQFFPNLDPSTVSREEFEALRKEVQELKILLLAAKRFDEATGQADCEMEEKVELIKNIAELVGVDLDEVFGQ
jgi:hypothetical protein